MSAAAPFAFGDSAFGVGSFGLGGPQFFVSAISGLRYLSWQPSTSESFYIPAAGLSVIAPIVVTASPFVYVAPQDVLVLIAAGLITSISYEGIYPPNAPGKFGNPPTPGSPFLMNFNQGNDFAIGVFAGDEIIVTYTAAPQMYAVH